MELSIDTASELASVALSQEGALVAECTWRCRRNHSVELLPSVERLLAQAGADKTALSAIFVSTGPGMYTGLRVGIATAKGLARALGIPLVGVGRLDLEAHVRDAFRVSRPRAVRGRRVLLVDDVVTTGATADECARVLRDAGARSVAVFAVCRAASLRSGP